MDIAKTQPRTLFPKGYKPDKAQLAAGRYGTFEMVELWGPDATKEFSLRAQGQAAVTLSQTDPEIIPWAQAEEIRDKATLRVVKSARIDEVEEEKGHDVIAINTALQEELSDAAKPHVNKAKTSADTTQPARAMQLKASLEVIAASAENLRDILLEKAMAWKEIPFMDTTHLYDAVPTVAGRPLVHYAEMLQSGLGLLKFVHKTSVVGKWADATGNHHSATTLGINGIDLQKRYCAALGIGSMMAPAQLPGLEFEADIVFAIARLAATGNNIAHYFAWGRSDDVNVFVNTNPRRAKGSSGMPHKDVKNGNPTAEEQFMSVWNYMMGNVTTALANTQMPYARNLAASANSRIILEDGFKFLDHGIRRLAGIAYWLGVDEEKSKARVLRSFGVVTSEQVMTYITDRRVVANPLARDQAHDLLGKLATEAWTTKTPFIDVLLAEPEISSRVEEKALRELTEPLTFIGQSKDIIDLVYNNYHGARTFGGN